MIQNRIKAITRFICQITLHESINISLAVYLNRFHGVNQIIQLNSYIKFEKIDLTKMSAEEVRIFSASNNNIKVNAEFHLDSPNGSILATVLCLPTGSNDYSGSVPSTFDEVTEANWASAGFSSKVSSEAGEYNKEFTISKFNRPLWDFARGENNGIHDIYVSFSYDRTPVMDEEQLANASHDGISVVYIGTATANARDENDKATFGAYRVCNEASDRPNIKFPAGQEVLVNEVASRTKAAGGKTVVVIQSVGVMDVSAFEENVDAIIWTAYNGMRQGEAHARVLFGDYNPGGHLTQTWYADDSQLYSYPENFLWDYSIDNRDGKAGRTYMYYNGTPRYPFGYGLSYTNFVIDNMSVSDPVDGIITVTADVTNTGDVDGAEVVQAYVKAPGAGNGTVPKQELKGFARVEVAAGETEQAVVEIELKDLAVIAPDSVSGYNFEGGRRVLMPGDYEIVVAYDSATPAESKTVALSGSELPLEMKVVTLKNDKVVALPGDEFGSEVSVCLTDETFLEPGEDGLSVVYTSSNPDVAVVDAETGVVTAVSGGTSLITATFTLDGQEMKATYPVSVLSMACLNALSINGEELEGFRYNKFIYDIELSPSETTEIPEFTWEAADDCEVICTPTTKIPGTSVIEVTKGTETVTYEFRFTYDPAYDDALAETVSTLDKFTTSRFPKYANANAGDMYADWTDIDNAPVNLKDHPNVDNLYLTFNMVWHAKDESKPLSSFDLGNGSNALRFRSADASKPGSPTDSNPPSLTEHNFGWRITQSWANEMHWGENKVKIPLGVAIQSPAPTTNRDTTANYQININGNDIVTKECHLGQIDWSSVRRVIMMIFFGNSVPEGNEVTLELEDMKIVDASIEMQTDSLRVELEKMLAEKIEKGQYTAESYNAYLAAYDKAEKINGIAAWPSPLKSMIVELQAAIDALEVGEDDAYAVNVAEVTGATVTADKAEAAEGETVTVTIADIEEGKEFESIEVATAEGTVEVTEVTAGAEYTFVMPAEAVTVTVTLKDAGGEPSDVDKGILEDLIAAVKDYEEDRFTTGSWAAFAEALAAAKDVVENDAATQEDVLSAYLDLVMARDGLTYAPDTSLLELALDIANDLLEKGTLDTDSENALKAAVKDAKAVLNDADATQEEVNEAFNAVMMAIVESQPKYTLDDLLALIKEAEALDKDKYTSSSYDELSEVLESVKDVAKNSEASDAAISDAYNALLDALGKLEFCVDYGNLKTAYGFAASLPEDKYDLSSVEGLLDLMDEAAEVLDAHDLVHSDENQAYVDDLAKELTVAVSKLRLRTAIAAANDLLAEIDEDDYTAASVETLKKALAAAEALDEGEKYEEVAVVNAAIADLEAAMDLKPAGNDKPSRPSGSSNSGSNSQVADSDYWAEVIEKINATEKGGKVNAKLDEGANVPATVIDALKNKGVTVVFEIGGKDYAVNGAGELKGYNAAAVYYTSDEIKAMAGNVPAASGTVNAPAANSNPETGGEVTAAAPAAPEAVIPAAPEAPVAIEPVAPAVPAEENIQAIAEAAEAETGMPAWMIAAIVVVAAAAVGGVSLTVIRRKREN